MTSLASPRFRIVLIVLGFLPTETNLAQMRRLLQADRLGIGATWVSPLVSAIPEAVPTLTLHHEELASDFGYRPTVAVLNDVPSYPESLVDEMAARGIRYLLVGANLFVSRPFPSHLTRTPFFWESSNGARVLTYVDPESYTAGIVLGPTCAEAWEPDRYPPDADDMENMRRAISAFVQDADPTFDTLIVQQAFDNWEPECARYTSFDVRRWNESGNTPRVELASPEHYFRDIEERYGDELPVYRAEWGGQWDAQHWAQRPVTYWRLRQAAASLTRLTPRSTRAAIATALDHNLGGSACSIWVFSESQVLDSGSEFNELMSLPIRLALGEKGLDALPTELSRLPSRPLTEPWLEVLATDAEPARFRSGQNWIGPFLGINAAEWEIPLGFGADNERIVIHAQIDRNNVPGSKERLTYVVIEIPLKVNRQSIRLAPEGVPNALMDSWLLDSPPNGIVTGSDGIRVIGLEREITVSSALIVSWTLLADQADSERTWLQGLVIAQSALCELNGGTSKVYPYELLYEGEPAILDVDVQFEFRLTLNREELSAIEIDRLTVRSRSILPNSSHDGSNWLYAALTVGKLSDCNLRTMMTQGLIDVDALSTLASVLLGTGALAVIGTILWKLVVSARARATAAYVLGALFSPFYGVRRSCRR